MKKYAFLSLFFLCTRVCFGIDFGVPDPKVIPVALINLLESPEKFDGKKIRVMGACSWNFEGSYLFLTREHCQAYDTESAVELACGGNLLPVSLQKLTKLEGRFVAIQGIFHSSGGVGNRPGIFPITYIMLRDKLRDETQRAVPSP